MNKVALLGDTHFGGRSDSIAFQNYFQRFYDDVFFPYLVEHNIKVVFQLGDLFDRRKYINFQSLDLAKKMFFNRFQELGIQLYTFPGNHDIYYKNTSEINALEQLIDGTPNINVVYEPVQINIDGVSFDLIPWINDENYKDSIEFIEQSTSDVCLGHFEIDGFDLLKGVKGHGGMSPTMFSSYHTVYSGHYHHESKNGNIHYIGTPYEMTWSDFNDPKGFHVLNLFDKKSYKVTNPYRMFHRVVFNEEMMVDFDYLPLQSSIVKIVTNTNSQTFDTFLERVYNNNPLDVIIDNVVVGDVDVDVSEIETEDTISIIMKSIDHITDDSIDKNKMKMLIQDIYVEAVELGRDSQ